MTLLRILICSLAAAIAAVVYVVCCLAVMLLPIAIIVGLIIYNFV